MEFNPGIIKEVLMYSSAEEFVEITANQILKNMHAENVNFDDMYESYFRERLSSSRTPDKELEYIASQKEKVRDLINSRISNK